MSLFQPGPYQSRIVSYVVRQTRRLTDRISVSLRELKDIASWSAQILLYPAYLVVQTARLAGMQLRQAIEVGLPRLREALADSSQEQDSVGLTVDAPIRRALQTVQEFALPTELPVYTSPRGIGTTSAPPPLERLVVSGYQFLSRSLTVAGKLVKTAFTGAGLQAEPQGKLAQVPGNVTPVNRSIGIQGIASLLETRVLVLVTNQNQVLDVLTTDQQAQLSQRISWETAHYGRYLKLRQMTRQVFDRLNQVTADEQALPVRAVRPVMAWLKSEPVQQVKTTVQQICETALLSLGWGQKKLSGQVDRPALAISTTAITADTPIEQVLQATQGLASAELLESLTQEMMQSMVSNRLVSSAAALARSNPTEANLQPENTALANSISVDDAQVDAQANPASVFVHGVATLLENRAIVLVTNQNQLLDILTAEQQKQVHKRIIWEVASYNRYLKMQQTRRWISRLRPSAPDRPVLPPVRAFQKLMAWVQTSPVAIAANLFQEASLVPASEFTADLMTWIPSIPNSSLEGANYELKGTQFVSPPVLQGVWSPALNGSGDLSLPNIQSPTSGNPSASSTPQHSPDYIDIQATLMGYMQTPLEKFFRLLDRLILWLEEQLVTLWKHFSNK